MLSLEKPALGAVPLGAPSDTAWWRPAAGPDELALGSGEAGRWARSHRTLLVGADLLALLIAATVGAIVGPSNAHLLLPALTVAAWLVALAVGGAYDLRHVGSGTAELPKVVGASLRVALLVAVVAYVVRSESAREIVLITLPVGTALLVGARVVARGVVLGARRRGHGQHRVLAVGTVVDVLLLLEESRRNPGSGFHVIGACVPRFTGVDRRKATGRRGSASEPTHGQRAGDRRAASDRRGNVADLVAAGVPVVGEPYQVVTAASASQADTIVVAGQGLLSRHALRRLAWTLEGTGVRIYFASSLSDVATPRITLRPLGSLPLLHVESPTFAGGQRLVKGASDRLLAAALVVLLSPVLVACAVWIKLDSAGPVLYRQERIGKGSRTFRCLKFRSMRTGADREVAALKAESIGDGLLFKMQADPRVTRAGRTLRRYSLDELPQLFNVLGGSMSLVGPRPPLLSEVVEYGHDVQRRLLVKPGMTGLWQVSGRSDLSWGESVRLDLYYVENWSPYFDLQLMARTVGAVLAGRGAY